MTLPVTDPFPTIEAKSFSFALQEWFRKFTANVNSTITIVNGISGLNPVVDDNTTNAARYPIWTSATSGTWAPFVSSTKFKFYPALSQLRLGFDGSNYNSFTTDATGNLTVAATGTNPNIILTPSGTGGVYIGNTRVDLQNQIDVFLIGGQSNAKGRGDSTLSPIVPTGKVLQYYSAAITDANDPVGAADTGSAWPAFGIAYYNATHRKIAFVPTAVSGSAQAHANGVTKGVNDWDDPALGGTLYTASITALNNAITAFTAAGYSPQFKGVLWDQGEEDAIDGTVDKTLYKPALIAMIARYRAATIGGTTYPRMPFYIFQAGVDNIAVPPSDFPYIRARQFEVGTSDFNTKCVYNGAKDFVTRTLMKPDVLGYLGMDEYHYAQAGYNEMGEVGASNVISHQLNILFLRASTSSNSASTDIYYTGGNVGIGTALPQYALDLVGDISAQTASLNRASYNPRFLIKDNTANTLWGSTTFRRPYLDFDLTYKGSGGEFGPRKQGIRMDITSDHAPYTTGTAARSGTTVNGSGTTWVSDMVGATITFSGGASSVITAFVSVTQLTVADNLGTVAATTYSINRQEVTSGISINIATQKDSGGDVSGVVVSQIGNGNAASFFRVLLTYNTGAASRTLTTVTGTGGATWDSTMIGGTVVFADGTTSLITAVPTSSTLTVADSGSVGSQGYWIQYYSSTIHTMRDTINRNYGNAIEAGADGNVTTAIFNANNSGIALCLRPGPDQIGTQWSEALRIIPYGASANLDKIYALLVRDTGGDLNPVGAVSGNDTFKVMMNGATNIYNTLNVSGTSGKVGIGTTSVADSKLEVNSNTVEVAVPAGTVQHVIGADSTNDIFLYDAFAGNAATVYRRANTTAASPSKLLSGDAVGGISARGWDNSGVYSDNQAVVLFLTTEDWNDATHRGMKIGFRATPAASGTLSSNILEVRGDGVYIPAFAGGGNRAVNVDNNGKLFV